MKERRTCADDRRAHRRKCNYKDFVFIVSGDRTKTMSFGNALNNIIENYYAVHEQDQMPDPLKLRIGKIARSIHTFRLYHMIIGRLRGDAGVRNLARRRLSHQMGGDTETIQQAIQMHRDSFYADIQQSLVIESYCQWYGMLPELRKAYPNAKVADIVRDPREWVPSWLNYKGHHDARDIVLTFGQSRLTPAMIGEQEWADQWTEMIAFQKLCWNWNSVYRLVDLFAQNEEHTAIFTEDIVDSDRPDMQRTSLDFVTTHGERRYVYHDSNARFGRRINASSGRTVGWTNWATTDARFLEEMCGILIAGFGYDTKPAWRAEMDGVETAGLPR